MSLLNDLAWSAHMLAEQKRMDDLAEQEAVEADQEDRHGDD